MKFGPRGYRGPRWDAYIDKEKEVDTTKEAKEKREEKERLMDMATTAALGGDYKTAETLAEQAGYPIERRPTVAPPEENMGIIQGPGGRAMYVGKGGNMVPAEQSNPEQTALSLISRFAAEKGIAPPSGTMPGKLGGSERYVQGKKGGGGYEEVMGTAEKKDEAKEKWPRDMYDEKGRSWKVYSADESKEAKKQGFTSIKPKDEKDTEYKPRKMYDDKGQEWEVRTLVEESSARSQGFSPIKPVTGDKASQAADLKTKRLNQYKAGMEANLRMYAGKDELIDQLLSKAGEAANFEELADLAKNAYERLKKKATQDKDKNAIIHLKNFEKFYNQMMIELGGEAVTPESTAALGTAPKMRTGEDYIKDTLKSGTQL